MPQKQFDEMFAAGLDDQLYGVEVQASAVWSEDNVPVLMVKLTGYQKIYMKLLEEQQKGLEENHELRVHNEELRQSHERMLGNLSLANKNTSYWTEEHTKACKQIEVLQERLVDVQRELNDAQNAVAANDILKDYPGEEILKAANELVEFLTEEYTNLELGNDLYHVFEAQALLDATSLLQQALPPESEPGG